MTRAINKFTLLAVALMIGLSGCAVTDFDRSANFSKYKSFSWGKAEIEVENPAYSSDLINRRIKETVEKEFAKRGIVRDPVDPDFIISYHTFTEDKQESRGAPYYGYPYMPFRYGFAWGYPFWGMPFGWGHPAPVETFTEGTLIIDVTDRETDELVWRGTVSGRVDNLAKLQRQIEKGIKAILKKYPVTPDEPLVLPQVNEVS